MANGRWRVARGRNGSQLSLVLAGLLAVLLLIAGKAHFVPFERARAALSDRTGPLLERLNAPLIAFSRWASGIGHFFDVYTENQRLREENARLLQWRGAAVSLQERVNQYQKLLKAVPQQS
jgi:rod shape-determining protein MreC